jgi:mono/diheme cytochrome c family protein
VLLKRVFAISIVVAGLGPMLVWCDPMGSRGHMMDGGMMGGGMMGQMPPGNSNQALPEPQSAGARLFQSNCGQCHALPALTAHTAQEWPQVVARMKQYMVTQGKAVPDRKQLEDLIHYLQRHAA